MRCAHRGPDGDGAARIGPRALVHTRLAIIDVAGGDQPLTSEDGAVTAIVNGEIYNHVELRARARGSAGTASRRTPTARSSSTSTRRTARTSSRRLNGIFAFALWDARRERLVAARDPFGVKPLYWATRRRAGRRSRPRSARCSRPAWSSARRPGRARPLPRLALRARAAHAVRRRLEAPAASILVAEPDGPSRVESYREAPGEPLRRAPRTSSPTSSRALRRRRSSAR